MSTRRTRLNARLVKAAFPQYFHSILAPLYNVHKKQWLALIKSAAKDARNHGWRMTSEGVPIFTYGE